MGKYFETFVPLLFSFSTGRAPICAVALALALLPACSKLSSEPVYGGLSMEGFNYTPYNLDRFVVRDKYGNTAGGGGDLMPGAGEGSLSCCYKLKGTDFTVDWEVYDMDARSGPYAPIEEIHKTTHVHLPPTKVTGEAGDVVLGLHFYPDDHIEFEFRHDLHGSRIDYSEVFGWLWNNYRKQAFPSNLDDAQAFRLTARIGADGWKKYRLTSVKDMKQYVYYTLIVNPQFDAYPAVQKILAETKGKPDAFGEAMQRLPPSVVNEIKHFCPQQAETNTREISKNG
ncbi:hypothetical protein [Paraburkholderia sp. J63]|uniref:hypothetical protein n=1 Tax=Paraburkholderia sp. J63 TaxID=2805434 RepID=UPI002ABD7B1E|nr:hypothetical protein [Paraburkholderia sp. J63]